MKKRSLSYIGSALLLAASLVAMQACAGRNVNVTNLPAGVTLSSVQDWISAAADLQTASNVTHSLQRAVDTAHNTLGANGTPLFPDGRPYADTRVALARIASAEITFADWLKTVPAGDFSAATKSQAFTFASNILSLIVQLNTSGVTGIKDANSLKVVNGFIADIQAAIGLIQLFAGGTAPVAVTPAGAILVMAEVRFVN